MNRDFKGIWIPAEIWLSKDLTVMEKLFLVEIDSLDNNASCFASNAYFSEFFGISKGRCTQIIKSLEEKNFIKIQYEREGKQITKRVIGVVNKLNRVVSKLNNPLSKTKQGYLENDEGSNTLSNNTINKRLGAKALTSKKFVKPTIDELENYKKENQFISDPQAFFDYHKSAGWVIGKSLKPMKDWKAAFRTWEANKTKWDGEKKARKNDSIKNGPSIEEKLTDRGWANEGFGSDAPVVDERVLEGNFIN